MRNLESWQYQKWIVSTFVSVVEVVVVVVLVDHNWLVLLCCECLEMLHPPSVKGSFTVISCECLTLEGNCPTHGNSQHLEEIH